MAGKLHTYEGSAIRVTWDARRCIHSGECTEGLPEVFRMDRRPWVSPDASTADSVAEVIHRCPSGALQFERLDGGAPESTPEPNSVRVAADGPLYLRGNLRLLSPEGEELVRDRRLALCRCGASKDKPFCDNSHLEIGFRGDGLAEAGLKVDPGVATDGCLEIVLATNGPYVLRGPVEIGDRESGESREGTRCSLCRCGASSRKPWCDGTHKEIGFQGGS